MMPPSATTLASRAAQGYAVSNSLKNLAKASRLLALAASMDIRTLMIFPQSLFEQPEQMFPLLQLLFWPLFRSFYPDHNPLHVYDQQGDCEYQPVRWQKFYALELSAG